MSLINIKEIRLDKVLVKTPHIKKNSSFKTDEVSIENELIRVIIAPQLGGKILSIKSKVSGTEFLTQKTKSSDLRGRLKYGIDFIPPFSFGFDECFPTVSSTTLYENNSEISYPDHGELWTQEWEFSKTENSCSLTANGVIQKYTFSKEITLQSNSILIVYNLKNIGGTLFNYLWASHPLLEIDLNDEIILPKGVKEVQVYYSTHPEFKKGEIAKWPIRVKSRKSLNRVQQKNSGIAAKLFAENMIVGKAALFRKKSNQSIVFNFDTNQISHLGIWLCYGGWPERRGVKDYSIALEPTTANTDCLSEAILKGSSKSIKPGQLNNWFTKISIEEGFAEV